MRSKADQYARVISLMKTWFQMPYFKLCGSQLGLRNMEKSIRGQVVMHRVYVLVQTVQSRHFSAVKERLS